jgi:acyl-CoA thioesterase-1
MSLLLTLQISAVEAQTNKPEKSNSMPPVLLIVGDSISSGYGLSQKNLGWVKQLETQVQREGLVYQVINASIAGDTTANGLSRLPNLLKKHNPKVVVIELGGNDGLRGLPVSQIQKNLNQMITLSQKQGAKVLLLGMKIPSNYGATYTKAFENNYQSLAKTHQVAIIPWLLQSIGANPDAYQTDGIHPNDKSQVRLLETVWPTLKPLLR